MRRRYAQAANPEACAKRGLSIDDAVWNHSTFSKNRDRLLEHAVVLELFAEVVRLAEQRGLLSTDHLSVDGTLIQAWASHKSFRPKDEGPGGIGRNQEHDFHGEQGKNDTHASTTDSDARLYRKSANTAAVLCYQGHTVVENRHSWLCVPCSTRKRANDTARAGRGKRATGPSPTRSISTRNARP